MEKKIYINRRFGKKNESGTIIPENVLERCFINRGKRIPIIGYQLSDRDMMLVLTGRFPSSIGDVVAINKTQYRCEIDDDIVDVSDIDFRKCTLEPNIFVRRSHEENDITIIDDMYIVAFSLIDKD